MDKIHFDIISMHMPYDVSHDMFIWLLYEAKHHLNKTGRLYIVTMNKNKPFLQRESIKIFRNYKRLRFDNIFSVSVIEKM